MKTSFTASTLAIAVFASSALATPTTTTSFDASVTIPGAGPLPVGIYRNLNFTNFNINAPVLNGTTFGVSYHSKANDAFANRGPLGSGILLPIVSTTGTKTKTFAVKNFYYGCYLSAENGAVAPVEPCTITVSGFKAGASTPFVTQPFKFTPEEGVEFQNPPTHGVFSSKFTGLQRIEWTVSPAKGVGFIIDDLVGTTTT